MALLIAIIALGSGALTVQLLLARDHLSRGAQHWRLTVRTIGTQSQLREPSVRAIIRRELASAEGEFAAARADLRLWSPLLVHLGGLPAVGPQLAAAPLAANASFYTTRAAIHMLNGLEPLWGLPDNHPHGNLLSTVSAQLLRRHSEFTAARADVDGASQALAMLPLHSGDAMLDAASSRLRQALPVLRAASAWLAIAPDLLGATRTRHYLIVLEDQTELRATGGFIAGADYVTLRHGSMADHFTGSALAYEIQSALVPLPEAMYTPETRWTFRDSNWSPDFPLSARLESWFYGEDTGRWADGVIDLTNNGVLGLLAAAGPVYLPGYRQWVDAKNALALTQRYVNGRYNGPVQRGTSDTVRKQFLGAVITALLQRMQALPLQRWPVLGAALTAAAGRQDFLIYDRRAVIESAAKEAGAAGDMLHPPGDYLYVVDDNRSYDKINPYVHEWATYQVLIRPNLWLDSTLTIHYHLTPSPANLEGLGPGFGLWGTKHDYQDFLRVYVPRGALLHSVSGLQPWAPAPAYGLTQFAGRLLVREGRSTTVTMRYSVPANVFAASGFERYSLTMQRQPGANLSQVRILVRGGAGVQVASKHGPLLSRLGTTLVLGRGATLDLAVRGRGRPQTVVLPPQPRFPDPYIPFASLRDPKHLL